MQRRALSLAFLATLLVAACAGPAARTHTLWPAVASAWPGVKADVELGIAAGGGSPTATAAVAQLDRAVAADDRFMLRGLNWLALDPLARAGVQQRVDSGEISTGVSLSFLERITKFSDAMQELMQP